MGEAAVNWSGLVFWGFLGVWVAVCAATGFDPVRGLVLIIGVVALLAFSPKLRATLRRLWDRQGQAAPPVFYAALFLTACWYLGSPQWLVVTLIVIFFGLFEVGMWTAITYAALRYFSGKEWPAPKLIVKSITFDPAATNIPTLANLAFAVIFPVTAIMNSEHLAWYGYIFYIVVGFAGCTFFSGLFPGILGAGWIGILGFPEDEGKPAAPAAAPAAQFAETDTLKRAGIIDER